jgi:hypothetical protein
MGSVSGQAQQQRDAKLIPADAVRVELDQPVVVDRAPPEIKEWGRWRMPKLSWLPDGELGLTFQLGRDHYCDQGDAAPLFRSRDQGRTWQRSEWPSPRFAGHPVISRLNDGDYWCFPSVTGIEFDPARIPPPIVTWNDSGCVFPIYRLADFPEEVQRWYRDLVALRWSPKTGRWSEEPVRWDHAGQLVFTYDDQPQKIPGVWGQKVYFETPVVRLGDELVHVDYWTLWEPTPGRSPQGWDSWLMVSRDNGRSWMRRSRLTAPTGGRMDCEPVVERTLDDGLVGVIRTEPGQPMQLVRSRDRGHTWTAAENLIGYGVFPWLQQLDNGVLVLAYGRAPGTWMSFSLDGGVSWTQPHALLEEDEKTLREHGSSDGYTSIVALDRDSVLVTYGDRNLVDPGGVRRKSILTRRVRVTPR